MAPTTVNPSEVIKATNVAAADAMRSALRAGKSNEEAIKLSNEAADAEYAKIKGTPKELESHASQDFEPIPQDTPQEDVPQGQDNSGELVQFDLYLTAVLDLAHGQFEFLPRTRKQRAALVVAHRVKSFDEFKADLSLLDQ